MNTIRVFLALVAISASAADIRDTVMAPGADAAATDRIVPDVGIYGMPYGCSEDAFIAKFGRPTGYVRITETQSAMLYGKSHAFFFTNGGLSGVRITQDVLDWRIANAMSKSTTFDVRSWQLDNGIRDGMNLAEVKRILGERLSDERYHKFYVTDRARVDLDFMTTVGKNGDEDARVYGVLVKLK
jgi:hypothetical protein